MNREEERIWKNLGDGENIIRIYLNLKIILNNKNNRKKAYLRNTLTSSFCVLDTVMS